MSRLDELFTSSAKWKVRSSGRRHFSADFITSNGQNYDFEVLDGSVSFYNLSRRSYEITKTGGEFEVFSTVLEILDYWVMTQEPDYFNFEAKEPSRARLYKAISKKFVKNHPEYTYREMPSDGMARKFVFTKSDAG